MFDAANQKIVVNDNWGDVPDAVGLKSAFAAQGAFALPDGSRDSAALVTLPPGSYTVQVAGVGTGTVATGVALVEVYEADASPSTLVNLSCRANVGTGANNLFAGFVISGTQSRRMLVRAVGPTLAQFGLTGTLATPKLEIYDSKSALVTSNSGWNDDPKLAAAFTNAGAFALPAGSKDAALLVTLPPGAYTAQISGVNNTTGLAIVEVYDLP
jgi:hypothetical protein